MINDSYIGYDKFLPEHFILYKRIVKVDLFRNVLSPKATVT